MIFSVLKLSAFESLEACAMCLVFFLGNLDKNHCKNNKTLRMALSEHSSISPGVFNTLSNVTIKKI